MQLGPNRNRSRLVWVAALYVMLVSVWQAPARAQESNCIEPWIEGCFLSTASCTDCAQYCANRGCVVESSECGADAQYCPSEIVRVYQECACQAP